MLKKPLTLERNARSPIGKKPKIDASPLPGPKFFIKNLENMNKTLCILHEMNFFFKPAMNPKIRDGR